MPDNAIELTGVGGKTVKAKPSGPWLLKLARRAISRSRVNTYLEAVAAMRGNAVGKCSKCGTTVRGSDFKIDDSENARIIADITTRPVTMDEMVAFSETPEGLYFEIIECVRAYNPNMSIDDIEEFIGGLELMDAMFRLLNGLSMPEKSDDEKAAATEGAVKKPDPTGATLTSGLTAP